MPEHWHSFAVSGLTQLLSEAPMTQTKLLVITNDNHMSEAQRTTFTAHVQAVADKVGSELLVLLPGQYAQLLDVRVTPDKATTGEIKEGLRTCSASRGAHLGSQPTGFTVPRDQVELIHKRVEDIGALLYRWDRAGMPAAPVDMGVSILQKVEATTAQLRDELSGEVRPMEAVEGMALSYCLDPLESAISLTVQALGDELSRMSGTGATSTSVYQRLGTHLDALLVEQLKRVQAHE